MLSKAVDNYLAIRRSVGFKLADHEKYLRSFTLFVSARGESHVQRQTALDWAALGGSPHVRDKRLAIVRQFACHARAENPRHEIPPHRVFSSGPRRRPIPYIFSQEEIRTLLDAALRLGPKGSRRPYTFRTLFGLMAATGLRVSEALALRLDDVNPDGLLVRETKFRKSRLVPLHSTTAVVLSGYIKEQRPLGGDCLDDHVFVSLHGRRYSYNTVVQIFCELLCNIGVRHQPGGPIPRLHCLRHTFAVRALEACPDGRDRIAKHMLALSTYLGHAMVADTYWYLQATPQLMTDIADACGAFYDGRIS